VARLFGQERENWRRTSATERIGGQNGRSIDTFLVDERVVERSMKCSQLSSASGCPWWVRRHLMNPADDRARRRRRRPCSPRSVDDHLPHRQRSDQPSRRPSAAPGPGLAKTARPCRSPRLGDASR
jgi:hypothetical protein